MTTKNKLIKLWEDINYQWYVFKKWVRTKRSHTLFYFSHSFKHANQARLIDYRNKYQGKRIFIVCNGPSLRAEDLDKIHANGDLSFGCNRIHHIFTSTKWRPTFYTMMDKGPLLDRKELIRTINLDDMFFRTDAYSTVRKLTKHATFLKTLDKPSLLEKPLFSEDCSQIIYFIETTTYCMIQIAAYMGFTEMYIIGCDNSYSINVLKDGTKVDTGQQSYFQGFEQSILPSYGKKSDNYTTYSRIWANNVAYETAQQYAQEHGLKIFNATRGGNLEAFPRIDFDSLFC